MVSVTLLITHLVRLYVIFNGTLWRVLGDSPGKTDGTTQGTSMKHQTAGTVHSGKITIDSGVLLFFLGRFRKDSSYGINVKSGRSIIRR